MVEGPSDRDTHLVRSRQHLIEALGINVEGNLVRVGPGAARLGVEEDKQDGAGSKWVMRARKQLGSKQLSVERPEPSGVRAAKGYVVDAENAHDRAALIRSSTFRIGV
jgi:hypothetical protein